MYIYIYIYIYIQQEKKPVQAKNRNRNKTFQSDTLAGGRYIDDCPSKMANVLLVDGFCPEATVIGVKQLGFPMFPTTTKFALKVHNFQR